MLNQTELKFRKTLAAFMRSLTKLLLIADVDTREFIEIAKAAYVDTATRDFGKSGKPASMLRVSELTGLTRREVKRIRDSDTHYGAKPIHDVHRESYVLHEWYRDATFHDRAGRPRALPFGPGDASFCELVAGVAPNSDPQQMLKRLADVGTVIQREDGSVEPVSRTVMIKPGLEQAVYSIEWGLLPIVTTTVRNLTVERERGWIHRNVNTHQVTENKRPMLRRILRDRTAEFTEAVDDLLAGYESDEIRATDPGVTAVGLCICYYELELGA